MNDLGGVATLKKYVSNVVITQPLQKLASKYECTEDKSCQICRPLFFHRPYADSDPEVKTTFLSVTKHETLDDKSLLTVMRELESLGQQ